MNTVYKILCASLCLLSLNTFAISKEVVEETDYFSFSCILPDDQSVHRFQAFGYLKVDKDGSTVGTISLQLIKGNEIRSVVQFNDVEAEGTLEVFEDSDNLKKFHILNLSTSIPYIRKINLIFKDSPLASSVLSIDYFNYRSDCKIIR